LDIDLSHFAPVNDSDQFNGLFSKSPVNSLSGTSQLSSLQLELPSDDTGEGTLVGLGENRGSAKKDIFAQVTGLGLGDEEGGLLLGADFTFDGDGNLVELEGREKTPFLSHKSPAAGDSEGVFDGRYNEHGHLRNDQVSIVCFLVDQERCH
jgi:meiotic recombination protein REC8